MDVATSALSAYNYVISDGLPNANSLAFVEIITFTSFAMYR